MENNMFDLNLMIDLSETLSKELRTPAKITVHEGKTLPADFQILKKLAKGGYGEVYVVERQNKIYAMKKVHKQMVMRNTATMFFMNEKEIMTTHCLDWLIKCYMCLQDEYCLYYIMEFIHGGDLLGYLSKKDIMKEEEIRFYAAEIITAIHEMHQIGWIHRDLKPDNILLDRNGHVKLADFGSCMKMQNGLVTSNTTVGTPDYISPDVLSSAGETVVYGPEVDYWTIGVIIYEMFYGVTPFYTDSLRETYSRIEDIRFEFEDGISEDLKDFIGHLICRKDVRYGYEEAKAHRFFSGIDWANLRKTEPPFKPQVKDEQDTSNFVDTEFQPEKNSAKLGFMKFLGFTHDPEHVGRIAERIKQSNGSTVELLNKEPVANIGDVILAQMDSITECKKREIDDLKAIIEELHGNREELAQQIVSLNQNLQGTLDQIAIKKYNLDQLQDEAMSAKEQLGQIKEDIQEKTALLESAVTDDGLLVGLADIRKEMGRFKLVERLESIRETVYWFYKQNQCLSSELKALSVCDGENRTGEEMKRQLRLQKSEIREYEQKIEQEIVARKKLEAEIKALKKSLREASKTFNNFEMTVVDAMSSKEVELSVENGLVCVDEKEYPLSTVYTRELKNNELHHLSYKRRGNCLRMFLLREPIRCSSSSGARRSLRVMETDLEKEAKILKGLSDLLAVLEGKNREEAELQMNGSTRKINELKSEIERAKKSTIVDASIEDSENVYEFNGHLFYEKTVAKGTLCDQCNEVLYGLVNQAYCCKDCQIVVHKSCYVLVDVSCELNVAIKNGISMAIICRSTEDKNRLLSLNKII